MSGFETILYEKSGPIAWITLNRPRVLNVYNIAMRDDLYQVLEAVRDDPEVEGVILSGAGERAFCAGADLTEFGTAPSQAIARKVRWQRDVWGLFRSMEKPLVAAMHGYVLGSGLEMALLCDIRIASEEALFGLPELVLGLIPAAGATQTLPRIIGQGMALDMLLTGRRLTATEAYDRGLVTRVVPHDALLPEAQALLGRILEQDTMAVRYAKRAVVQGMDLPLPQALELEARLAVQLLARGRTRILRHS